MEKAVGGRVEGAGGGDRSEGDRERREGGGAKHSQAHHLMGGFAPTWCRSRPGPVVNLKPIVVAPQFRSTQPTAQALTLKTAPSGNSPRFPPGKSAPLHKTFGRSSRSSEVAALSQTTAGGQGQEKA